MIHKTVFIILKVLMLWWNITRGIYCETWDHIDFASGLYEVKDRVGKQGPDHYVIIMILSITQWLLTKDLYPSDKKEISGGLCFTENVIQVVASLLSPYRCCVHFGWSDTDTWKDQLRRITQSTRQIIERYIYRWQCRNRQFRLKWTKPHVRWNVLLDMICLISLATNYVSPNSPPCSQLHPHTANQMRKSMTWLMKSEHLCHSHSHLGLSHYLMAFAASHVAGHVAG